MPHIIKRYLNGMSLAMILNSVKYVRDIYVKALVIKTGWVIKIAAGVLCAITRGIKEYKSVYLYILSNSSSEGVV